MVANSKVSTNCDESLLYSCRIHTVHTTPLNSLKYSRSYLYSCDRQKRFVTVFIAFCFARSAVAVPRIDSSLASETFESMDPEI